jgi:hypothetical protein
MFEDQTIESIDTCGCGDTGYLTTRTIPIDLNHGVGHIDKVPVYHCRSEDCQEYTLPPVVSRRLEVIAEQMEESLSTEAIYTWEIPEKSESLDPFKLSTEQTLVQTFTLQFSNRQYADARVELIVPGQAIFLHSTLDDQEYYLLNYEPEPNTDKLWFTFYKFYYEESELTYEDFLEWSENGHLKELGRITLEDIEDALIDEFGDWI